MEEIFLPNSLSPSILAEELLDEMETDIESTGNPRDEVPGNREQPKLEDATRIIVDALVTTPTATTRWYQASLTSIVVTIIILSCLIFGHAYIHAMLLWIQEADVLIGLVIFTALFFAISFPLFWGYTLLLLASGYLYGCIMGLLVVISCGAVGLACANIVMRNCCRAYFMDKFYSAKVDAIVQVINGGAGFKVVALTRLTPIPYGLQNALFSLSEMGLLRYLLASIVGQNPMAILYTYMGSTLRSMEDVMSDQTSQVTGYLILSGQMLFTIALLCFVIRKARLELKRTVELTCDSQEHFEECTLPNSGV